MDATSHPDSVIIERLIDAPVDLVWKAWTVPSQFKQWYGPQGAVIPVAEMDVRQGGERRVCMQMQTQNGAMKMWLIGQHLEVDQNRRLLYTESMADEQGNVMSPASMGMPDGQPDTTQVSVDLQQVDQQAKIVLTHAGLPADSPGAMGWNMALDKLESYLLAED